MNTDNIKQPSVEGKFGTGGLISNYDSRDVQWNDVGSASLPFDWNVGFDVEKELSKKLKAPDFKITVKDQKSSSSCGGQAWSYLAEILEALSTGTYESRSAKYIYAQTHLPGGGSAGRDNANVFYKQGVAREAKLSSQPATELNLTASIDVTNEIRGDALLAQSLPYASLSGTDIESMAQAMRDNYGVIILIEGENNGTWLSTYPKPPQNIIWRHFLYVGKSRIVDGKKYLGVLNSWGEGVGEKGWQFLGEDYFKSGHIAAGWTHVYNPPILPSVGSFNTDMAYGQSSTEIARLQLFLQGIGYFPQNVMNTGYYGSTTRDSIYAFQKNYVQLTFWEYWIQRGSKVGPKTRLALNNLINK